METPLFIARLPSRLPSRAPLLVLVLVVAAAIAGGCGGSPAAEVAPAAAAQQSDAGPPQHGGTLRIGSQSEPGVLNRHIALGGVTDATVSGIVSDPLIEADSSWRLFPQLATRVPTTANGGVRMRGERLVVTVDLRPAAEWSDGVPITCADVKFTWKTMRDDRWLIISRIGWSRVEQVNCLTPKRAEFVFDGPYASYMRVLLDTPLPKHELEGKDFNAYWNDRITVTSGPFMFDRWERGKRIELVRNPNYWKRGKEGLPYLERIIIEFYRDPNTLDIQLSSGRLDMINRALEAPAHEERQVFPRNQYIITPGTAIEHLGFNTSKAPLNDVDVRRALGYAIDRVQLTDVVLGAPFEVVDSTLLPAQGPYFLARYGRYRKDSDGVGRHLERAGYTFEDGLWQRDGKPLELVYKSVAGKPLRLRLAQMLQQQLRRQGITLDIALEQSQVFFGETLSSGAFDIAQWGFGVGVDPEQRGYFSCAPAKGVKNAYRFCNREMDRIINEGDQTIDVTKRVRLMHRFQELMADNIPLLPLYQHQDLAVLAPHVHGVVPNPQAGIAWNVERWWVEG